MQTSTWCRQRATDIYPPTVGLVAEMVEVNALFRLRAAQGILGLAEKYNPDRLEAACGMAMAVGDVSYRTDPPRPLPRRFAARVPAVIPRVFAEDRTIAVLAHVMRRTVNPTAFAFRRMRNVYRLQPSRLDQPARV